MDELKRQQFPRSAFDAAFKVDDGSGRPLYLHASSPEERLSLSVRRWLYKKIEPLDKGDFRWEFLVPFNNKTLNASILRPAVHPLITAPTTTTTS